MLSFVIAPAILKRTLPSAINVEVFKLMEDEELRPTLTLVEEGLGRLEYLAEVGVVRPFLSPE